MTGDKAELSCFVVSPIGNKHAEKGSPERERWEQSIEIWEEVIEPACLGVGLSALRADQINEAGDVTDQVFRRLRDSHVVIADLTGANPNVMYELGLRHTTGKLTLQIGEDGRLPFDVSTIRTIRFRRTNAGLIEARRTLVQALASGINGGHTPVMATRVWLESPDEALEIGEADTKADQAEGEEDDGPGSLEILAEMETALSEMSATIVAAGNVIEELTEHLGQASQRLERAGGPDAPISARLAIANALATSLEGPADRLEPLAASLADSVRRSDPGIRIVLQEIAKDPVPKALENLRAILQVANGLSTGLASIRQFRDTLAKAVPLTRMLGKHTRRIARALTTMDGAQPSISEWLSRAEPILPSDSSD